MEDFAHKHARIPHMRSDSLIKNRNPHTQSENPHTAENFAHKHAEFPHQLPDFPHTTAQLGCIPNENPNNSNQASIS